MIKAVVDTNVLVSRYLSPTGATAQVYQRWREKEFVFVVSEPILAEYHRVLAYDHLRRLHRFTDVELAALIDNLRGNAQVVALDHEFNAVVGDPSDDKFVEAAVAGDADFIVSGDRHLLQLRTYLGVRVLTPAAFLAVLDAENQ